MLIIRLITGKSKGVEDTREFDQNSKTNVNGVHQNGLTKSKFSFFLKTFCKNNYLAVT